MWYTSSEKKNPCLQQSTDTSGGFNAIDMKKRDIALNVNGGIHKLLGEFRYFLAL